jgi:ribosome biogenesis GTPase
VDRGRVYGSEGGVYRVCLESGEEVEATLRGRLKRQARTGDKVVVGDRVEIFRDPDGTATIEDVHPRETEVVRRGPGGRRPKVVAANVHRLVIVMAVARPEPRQALIDRLLIIGEANGLEPVLVLNKLDLREISDPPGIAALLELYRELGYRVLATSVKDGRGLDLLREVLCHGTSALVGPSGVGKSSLLNAIQPGLGLRIGELSQKRGGGRHTTVSGRLIPLACGGLVADTPGFSDAGVWGVEPRELERCFPDFAPYRDACRFRECTHLHEPGCRVREALEEGWIDPVRFASYRALRQDAGGEWS